MAVSRMWIRSLSAGILVLLVYVCYWTSVQTQPHNLSTIKSHISNMPKLNQNSSVKIEFIKVPKNQAMYSNEYFTNISLKIEPRKYPKHPVVYLDEHITNKSELLSSKPIIPRIIHQTWKGYNIPSKFVPLVKTWPKVNPDYEYWFWTDVDAARFVKLRFPQYYDTYKNYPQNIHRADAMRYFILREFGGWYADMDIEAIRPIDQFSRSHQCVISQEPWAHTKIIWNKNRLACNALMAARPNHPLLDLIIRQLPENDKKTPKDQVMSKTGPTMVDTTVTLYEKEFTDKFTEDMSVYLADPDAFLPTLAANAMDLVKRRCSKKQASADKQAICDRYIKSGYANDVPPGAYTNHVWVHTYYGIDEKKNVNIFNLIPNVVKVNEILDQMDSIQNRKKSLEKGHI